MTGRPFDPSTGISMRSKSVASTVMAIVRPSGETLGDRSLVAADDVIGRTRSVSVSASHR
jgi:hypothetical protein